LDEKFSGEATAVFKELGLTQDQASKLVKLYMDRAVHDYEAPYRRFEEMQTEWRGKVVSDPALGDGADLKPEVKATLGRAIDSMGPQLATEFRQVMADLGAAVHPVVIRGLLAMAQQATEGRPVRGGGPSPVGQSAPGSRPSAAKSLYPNLA